MRELLECGLFSTGQKPIPLVGVKATGTITGRTARIRVCQRFVNREKKAIEAVYKFPLPEAAAVCGFTIRVGEKTIVGSVEARDEAFEKYDRALAEGDGGFLLDQERPNIFTLSVGNVKPETEVVVETEYVETLDADGREIRFVLPTTISPRYLPADQPDEAGIPVNDLVNPRYALDVPYGISISLEIGNRGGLEAIESPSHPISVGMEGESAKVAFGVESVKLDRDFVLVMRRQAGFSNRAYRCGDFILVDFTLAEAEDAPGGPASGSEIIFILDCSGSMSGSSIAEAKKALEICLKSMDAGSYFNIYRFGSSFAHLFDRPIEYGDQSLDQALKYVSNTEADLGGTEMYAPLEHACRGAAGEGRKRFVILITDGQVGNEERLAELVGKNAERIKFSAIGIGYGPNEFLLKRLALAGGGLAEFVHPGERIEPKMLNLFGKTFGDYLEAAVVETGRMESRQAPAEMVFFPGRTGAIFVKVAGNPDRLERITLRGRVNGAAQEWTLPVETVKAEGNAIPVLWARERIRDLEEGGDQTGSRQEGRKKKTVQPEVVKLSKEYGLLSSFASYVGIEKRAAGEKETGAMELRKVPVMLTAGWHGMDKVSFILAADSHKMYGKKKACCFPCRPPAKRAAKKTARRFMPSNAAVPLMRKAPGGDPLIIKILALQRKAGGLDFDDEVAWELGIGREELLAAAGGGPETENETFTIIWTAVVMELLNRRFFQDRDTWFAALAKSRKWLKAAAGKAPLIAGG
ncbi:MAG TPA: VIT domain-containing protein, partial [bacterium]|nr:VIT domain-containing protein [bacterium]